MKIFLFASFPCEVKVLNQNVNLSSGDILLMTDYFNEEIFISPLSDTLLPYHFNLSYRSNFKHIKLIEKEDFMFCQILPSPSYSIIDEHCLIEKFGSHFCMIRYFSGEYGHLTLSLPSFEAKREIRGLKTIQVKLKQVLSEEFLFVILTCETGEYLILLSQKKIIWEGFFKEINIVEKEILILEDSNCCLGEKLVTKFNVEKDEIESYPIVYTKKTVQCVSPIPPFLDSVLVHNYSAMKRYVNEELTGACNSDINKFFGEFDDYIIFDDICVLTKNFEAQKLLRFKVLDNLIVDILD